MTERLFRDRRDAGRTLARLLDRYRGQPDVVVLGPPRGGVPVAYEGGAGARSPAGRPRRPKSWEVPTTTQPPLANVEQIRRVQPTQRCPRRTHPRIPSRGIRTNNHRPDRRQASPNARASRRPTRTTHNHPTDRASIPTINTPPLELAPFTVTMKWHPSGPRLRSLNSRSRSDTRPDRPNTSVDPATQL